jgi:hypothetical protein
LLGSLFQFTFIHRPRRFAVRSSNRKSQIANP